MDFVLSGITSATLERKDELVRVRLVYSSILKRLGPGELPVHTRGVHPGTYYVRPLFYEGET